MTATCHDCRKPLGKNAQLTPTGVTVEERCVDCTTKLRTKWMLTALPTPADRQWDQLTEFEQTFLPSVREQFARKGQLSEKQFLIIERIYGRL